MEITIISTPIVKQVLQDMAKQGFGDLVKAVVDIEKEIMAIGGELHADEEAILLENGSQQHNLWGINIYPQKSSEEWIEFDSMINLRPSHGNRSRGVEDSTVREKIYSIVTRLIV